MPRFAVLGPIEADGDDGPCRLGGALRRAVLGTLLLEANRVVSDQALLASLWSVPPATAMAQLRQHVSGLRAALGRPTILRRGTGYVIRVEREHFDLEVFTRRVEHARAATASGRLDEASAAFREALALWRGTPMGGAAHDFVERVRPALEERRLAAMEEWFDVELALGRHCDLVGELLTAVGRHPFRERLRGQLMIALYRCGRRPEALAVFREGGALLRDELGLEPGPDLRRLERAVHVGDPVLNPPPAAAPPRGRSPLPADTGDFTGRNGPLAAVRRVLAGDPARSAPALCVISGGPGVGKSALALHAAHLLAADFPGGRFHLDLRDRDGDPAEALARLLRQLGAGSVPDSLEDRASEYRGRLAGSRSLVILDNASGERSIRPLLPGDPGCAVLVTSRSRLTGLGGADRVHLDLFDAGQSVELLARIIGAERVRAEPAAAASIAELCGHLPLALRIAGIRLAARPHARIERFADRMRDEDRRLDELKAGDLDLRAVFADSHVALRPSARQAFRLLGVHTGGRFCATVAAEVLEASLEKAEDEIDGLADAGLIDYAGIDAGGHDTYRTPGLLRLFARDLFTRDPAPAT
ncbi:BTAD domain-containing putative transcriptional regulator [Spirillospora sp. NPDC048911]|uniref:AfsR/SARP family transcriptional regulator n=1 Tax=Spirillospora sp. NPDC048911 TaxID=3364527 RepID=UPI00372439C7